MEPAKLVQVVNNLINTNEHVLVEVLQLVVVTEKYCYQVDLVPGAQILLVHKTIRQNVILIVVRAIKLSANLVNVQHVHLGKYPMLH